MEASDFFLSGDDYATMMDCLEIPSPSPSPSEFKPEFSPSIVTDENEEGKIKQTRNHLSSDRAPLYGGDTQTKY